MSSQPPNTIPVTQPFSHGGDMDPNEVRLRQARGQAATMSSVPSASNPGAAYPAAGSHGGAMDHNEVRLRLTQQQASAWTSPVQNSSSPNNAAASLGGPYLQQTLGQSSQYGSGSRLISPPVSPLPGVQTPRSTSSGQYFPSQYNDQSPYSGQAPQPASTNQSGIPLQVSYGTRYLRKVIDTKRHMRIIPSYIPQLRALLGLRMFQFPHMGRLNHRR